MSTKLTMTVKEFCEALGISPATFWKYHVSGKIKAIRIGRRVLIPMPEVNRILTEGLN